MRWLLGKDLLILRRSRLLLALLIVYPVVISLLIGFAISRSPSRPRVAIVDETPPGVTIDVGSKRIAVSQYAGQLFNQVDSVAVPTRSAAVEKVKDGSVLAAVVIPPDIAARLSSGITQGQLEVIYNGNALEQSLAQSTISSALAKANLGFSEEIQRGASEVLGELLRGGNVGVLGAPGNLVGLREIPSLLQGIITRVPLGRRRKGQGRQRARRRGDPARHRGAVVLRP